MRFWRSSDGFVRGVSTILFLIPAFFASAALAETPNPINPVTGHSLANPALNRQADIQELLRSFKKDSLPIMTGQVKLQRWDRGSPRSQKITSEQKIQFRNDPKTRMTLNLRDDQGKLIESDNISQFMKKAALGRAGFDKSNLAENLVIDPKAMIREISELDHFREAELKDKPWSDDYWPIYKGVLSNRYLFTTDVKLTVPDPTDPAAFVPTLDPRATDNVDWKINYSVAFEKKSPQSFFQLIQKNSSSLDDLSPSEKYDLLVGDKEGSLTRAMWKMGEQLYDPKTHELPSWQGICHGWAPAAYMLPRPTSVVTAVAADGTKIHFYPSDIKGLASLLWAQLGIEANFLGTRCDTPAAKLQLDKNGRIKDPKCFDVNPGAWHLAVVNQVGVSQQPFVIDSTFDQEVWNQPVEAYSYTYFNPETQQAFEKFDQAAIVTREDYKSDRFSSWRKKNKKYKYVIGIAMDLTYVVETDPSHQTTDSQESDAVTTVRYLYDLELDENQQIVGGEWYQNEHPDFAWTPPMFKQKNGKPTHVRVKTDFDQSALGTWDDFAGHPMPAAWQTAAKEAASAPEGAAPLAKIVETLIMKSAPGSWLEKESL